MTKHLTVAPFGQFFVMFMLASVCLSSAAQASIIYSGPVSGYAQLGPQGFPTPPYIAYSTNDLLPNATYSDSLGTSYVSTSFIEAPSAAGFRFVAELGGSLVSSGGNETHLNAYMGEIFNFTIDTSYSMSISDSTFERNATNGGFGSYGSYQFYVCEISSCASHNPGNIYQFRLSGNLTSGLFGVAWPPVTIGPGTYRVIASITDYLSVYGYEPYTSFATQNILTGDLQLAPAVVPIPAAAWLFVGALASLNVLRRRTH